MAVSARPWHQRCSRPEAGERQKEMAVASFQVPGAGGREHSFHASAPTHQRLDPYVLDHREQGRRSALDLLRRRLRRARAAFVRVHRRRRPVRGARPHLRVRHRPRRGGDAHHRRGHGRHLLLHRERGGHPGRVRAVHRRPPLGRRAGDARRRCVRRHGRARALGQLRPLQQPRRRGRPCRLHRRRRALRGRGEALLAADRRAESARRLRRRHPPDASDLRSCAYRDTATGLATNVDGAKAWVCGCAGKCMHVLGIAVAEQRGCQCGA